MGKQKNNRKSATRGGTKASSARKGKGGGWLLPVLGAALIGLVAFSFWGGSSPFTGKSGAAHRVPGGERRQPLPAAYFGGVVARGYQIAREIPQVLDKLYCYCNCIENVGHLSNLSCFTDRHAAG